MKGFWHISHVLLYSIVTSEFLQHIESAPAHRNGSRFYVFSSTTRSIFKVRYYIVAIQAYVYLNALYQDFNKRSMYYVYS